MKQNVGCMLNYNQLRLMLDFFIKKSAILRERVGIRAEEMACKKTRFLGFYKKKPLKHKKSKF